MGSYWSKMKDCGHDDDEEPDAARKTTQWQVVRLKHEVRIEDRSPRGCTLHIRHQKNRVSLIIFYVSEESDFNSQSDIDL